MVNMQHCCLNTNPKNTWMEAVWLGMPEDIETRTVSKRKREKKTHVTAGSTTVLNTVYKWKKKQKTCKI